MTPREIAYQLCNEFYEGSALGKTQGEHLEEKGKAKQRALICVGDIIYHSPLNPYHTLQPTGIKAIDYWREVKKEIEKL